MKLPFSEEMTKLKATRGKELSRESVHEAELSTFQKVPLNLFSSLPLTLSLYTFPFSSRLLLAPLSP